MLPVNPSNTITLRRFVVPSLAGFSLLYSLVVLWYVATFPELGIRCLLPKVHQDSSAPERVSVVRFQGEAIPVPLKSGDRLVSINDQPVETFFDFLKTTSDLSVAALEAGARLHPNADPVELTGDSVPALVEIPDPETGTNVRYVHVEFLRSNTDGREIAMETAVAVTSPATGDVLLTVMWVLGQSVVMVVALAGFWQRPTDSVARTFCLMSSASMVAFVGGFHWWIIAGNPLLNIPFALCITLVPAATLHFFLKFPREGRSLLKYPRLTLSCLYGVLGGLGIMLSCIYWAAYSLNGQPGGDLTSLQQLASVAREMIAGNGSELRASELSWELLYWLRQLIYLAIFISGLYFAVTVVSILSSLFKTQTVIEKRQASTILIATLFATLPVGRTLYLAFFSRDAFVLGGAQGPMFLASGMFMAAYAHSMLRHRLILADEKLHRGGLYQLTTVLVTITFAALLAAVVVTARQYSLPGTSSVALRFALFVILVLAVSLALWTKDRMQAAIDLRFFSEKYQLDRALEQLNQAAAHLTDPTAMAGMTLRTLREVVDASSALMYVREGSGSFRLIGGYGAREALPALSSEHVTILESAEAVVLRIPATNRETITGVQLLLDDLNSELILTLRDDKGVAGGILLGRRASNTTYSAEDIAFLQAIGQMTLLALHSSRANQNLARLTSELQVKVDHISEQQRQLSVLRAELMAIEQHATASIATDERNGFDRCGMRGSSLLMEQVLDTARKASDSTSTVLVRGESGTGKELLARVIQRNSSRADAPFVSVNCAALAPSLLESELFGHVRGAFTGAESNKAGRFQAADGGTLFLDEIGDISPETQVKLLRVLQEQSFEAVGSNETIQVDVRVITATHRNLEEMIAEGTFREDLYYRLNVVSITLPPLRDRREDLIELIFSFLKNAVSKTGKRIRQIDPQALTALENHAWPGNIRELENAIERAVVLADGDTVHLADLPDDIARHPVVPLVADQSTVEPSLDSSLLLDMPESLPVTTTTVNTPAQTSPEYRQLTDALSQAGGNKAQAARLLNMPRSTFYSKLRKYRIDGSGS